MGCSQAARQRTLAPPSLVRIQPPQPSKNQVCDRGQKMRRALAIAIVSVILGLFLPQRSYGLSTADLFKRYSPSVATLIVTRKDGKTSQGTGFLISAGGEILTNFHVIDNAESVEVYFSDSLWYSAKRIVAQDPEKDLALLWVERVAPSLSYLQISQAKIPEGS